MSLPNDIRKVLDREKPASTEARQKFWEPSAESGAIPYYAPGTVIAQLNFLQGRILTIADAAFSDQDQRKAVKDLIKDQFRDRLSYMRRLIGDDSNSETGECTA